MPKSFLLHTILLFAAVSGVYVWVSTPSLSAWTLQIVGLLVLAYAATHWIKKKRKTKYETRSSVTLDLTLLTSMVLILVTETGALASPFFFLLYFLLFVVAFVYEIEATLVLTGTLLLYFLILPLTNLSDLAHLSPLFALLMITPLAIFTGHQYESIVEMKKTTASLSKHLGQEESDILIFLSLNLKKTLLSSLDSLSIIIPKTQVKDARGRLELLYQDLRNLYRSADELQQIIDRETDDK